MSKGAQKSGNPNGKLRGVAGGKNGARIPFRYGGSSCDLSTHIGRTHHPRGAGSRLAVAMTFAHCFGPITQPVSERLMLMSVAADDHCRAH